MANRRRQPVTGLFALADLSAVAGLGIEGRDTGATGADALG